MMTEDEAKTTWCPYTAPIAAMNTPIRSTGLTVEIMGDGRLTPGTLCIGSKCMAWRPVKLVLNHVTKDWIKHGYCGAFERPLQ